MLNIPDPIVSSRSPIAALLVGLRSADPFLSLPMSTWIDFARSAKSTEWQALTKLPLSIRETTIGIELVDSGGTAIACAEMPVEQRSDAVRGGLEMMAIAFNKLAGSYRPS